MKNISEMTKEKETRSEALKVVLRTKRHRPEYMERSGRKWMAAEDLGNMKLVSIFVTICECYSWDSDTSFRFLLNWGRQGG